MKYYHITKDGKHIGVSTDNLFLRWQPKHKILVWCDVQEAQYILFGDTLYHDGWMVPENEEKKGVYPTAEVQEITETVYNALLNEEAEQNPEPADLLKVNTEYETVIREVIQAETMALNSSEGEKVMTALHDAAKKQNPNLTTKEWNQIKKNLLVYLFNKITKPDQE